VVVRVKYFLPHSDTDYQQSLNLPEQMDYSERHISLSRKYPPPNHVSAGFACRTVEDRVGGLFWKQRKRLGQVCPGGWCLRFPRITGSQFCHPLSREMRTSTPFFQI